MRKRLSKSCEVRSRFEKSSRIMNGSVLSQFRRQIPVQPTKILASIQPRSNQSQKFLCKLYTKPEHEVMKIFSELSIALFSTDHFADD